MKKKERKKFIKKHGFPPEDLWDIDSWLCEALGKRMTAWSKNVMSYPADLDPETWQKQIADIGKALENYKTKWYSKDDAVVSEAQAALHWIADNLETLWD